MIAGAAKRHSELEKHCYDSKLGAKVPPKNWVS